MIIFDSCIWIALLNSEDSCHEQALEIFEEYKNKRILLPDFVYIEVLNLLKRKTSMEICKNFLQTVMKMGIDPLSSGREELTSASGIFFNKNRLSFTDCLLIAMSKLRNMMLITFDRELSRIWKLA